MLKATSRLGPLSVQCEMGVYVRSLVCRDVQESDRVRGWGVDLSSARHIHQGTFSRGLGTLTPFLLLFFPLSFPASFGNLVSFFPTHTLVSLCVSLPLTLVNKSRRLRRPIARQIRRRTTAPWNAMKVVWVRLIDQRGSGHLTRWSKECSILPAATVYTSNKGKERSNYAQGWRGSLPFIRGWVLCKLVSPVHVRLCELLKFRSPRSSICFSFTFLWAVDLGREVLIAVSELCCVKKKKNRHPLGR